MSNLAELKAKRDRLDAEIERLQAQVQGVWEPEVGDHYYCVHMEGDVEHFIYPADSQQEKHMIAYHNVYKTYELAEKASRIMRQTNRIIQACINAEDKG